jgi:hypothetical protein
MTWKSEKLEIPKSSNAKKITPEQLAASGTEHGDQAALFCWAADEVEKYPQLKYLFAIPNGFFATSGQKGKMKAEGLRKGIPDTFLPYPLNGISCTYYHGCFIEMKREKYRNKKDGGCSEEQLDCIDYLKRAGYYVNVCYNWTEARDTLIAYMEGKL